MEGRAKTLKRCAFIRCFYNIYARKIYVRTHVKLTRQWKSTLIPLRFPLAGQHKIFDYCAVGGLL